MALTVVAIADLHGWLPSPPACDLLLIAGDICPDGVDQTAWLDTQFRRWLEAVPARHVVATWGNHDYAAEWGCVPALPCTFLVDAALDIEGLRLYGTPWTPESPQWAFSEPEHVLAERFARIPDDTDILISHCPPRGWCDWDAIGRRGSVALEASLHRARPRLTVCGHAHDGYGGGDAPWGRVENVAARCADRTARAKPFVTCGRPVFTAPGAQLV